MYNVEIHEIELWIIMVVNSKKTLEEDVMKAVGDHLGIPQFRLSLQTDLMDDLGADLLDIRELIITIEELFEMKIPDKDLSYIKRIEDIVKAISKYKAVNKIEGVEHGKRAKIKK